MIIIWIININPKGKKKFENFWREHLKQQTYVLNFFLNLSNRLKKKLLCQIDFNKSGWFLL